MDTGQSKELNLREKFLIKRIFEVMKDFGVDASRVSEDTDSIIDKFLDKSGEFKEVWKAVPLRVECTQQQAIEAFGHLRELINTLASGEREELVGELLANRASEKFEKSKEAHRLDRKW